MLSRIILFSARSSLQQRRSSPDAAPSGRLGSDRAIVAGFYPLAFAAEQIAAAGTDVHNLTPAGAEPHDLELTPGDVRAVD